MRKKLLVAMLLASVGLSAQETHHINWFMGVSDSAASAEVAEGDTVTWHWTDTMPHTVTSVAGGAESFDSGSITGNGQTYSHTFTEVGETSYVCSFHGGMNGTITVTGVAGVEGQNLLEVGFYPNPVNDVLTINAAETIEKIVIHDINGRLIMDSPSGNKTSKVYMQNYPSGIYFIQIITAEKTGNIKIVKQ